jgi:hypothetical protein
MGSCLDAEFRNNSRTKNFSRKLKHRYLDKIYNAVPKYSPEALYEKISDLINYPFIRSKILVAHKNLPMPTNYL